MENLEYSFTEDWFSRHIPAWSKLLESLKPSTVLEIGSYEGRSACFLIEACTNDDGLSFYCVDTWEGGIEHDGAAMAAVERRFDHNIEVARSKARKPVHVQKLKARSSLALAELISSPNAPRFDLVHIDGSHQAIDVLADAVMSFQLLRTGGLMIFDDYLWNMEFCGDKELLNTPKLAIDSFCNVFHKHIKIIRGLPLYQLYLQKVSD